MNIILNDIYNQMLHKYKYTVELEKLASMN